MIVERINVKIDESIFRKTKKESKNIDILEDHIDIELKQEKKRKKKMKRNQK